MIFVSNTIFWEILIRPSLPNCIRQSGLHTYIAIQAFEQFKNKNDKNDGKNIRDLMEL